VAVQDPVPFPVVGDVGKKMCMRGVNAACSLDGGG
jgi:hypothetical protein